MGLVGPVSFGTDDVSMRYVPTAANGEGPAEGKLIGSSGAASAETVPKRSVTSSTAPKLVMHDGEQKTPARLSIGLFMDVSLNT
jgi:hypothetical protein